MANLTGSSLRAAVAAVAYDAARADLGDGPAR